MQHHGECHSVLTQFKEILNIERSSLYTETTRNARHCRLQSQNSMTFRVCLLNTKQNYEIIPVYLYIRVDQFFKKSNPSHPGLYKFGQKSMKKAEQKISNIVPRRSVLFVKGKACNKKGY
jgi:hypothetical protein